MNLLSSFLGFANSPLEPVSSQWRNPFQAIYTCRKPCIFLDSCPNLNSFPRPLKAIIDLMILMCLLGCSRNLLEWQLFPAAGRTCRSRWQMHVRTPCQHRTSSRSILTSSIFTTSSVSVPLLSFHIFAFFWPHYCCLLLGKSG